MVCRNCEKSIAKNSNFCKYCGTEVIKAEKKTEEKPVVEVVAEPVVVEDKAAEVKSESKDELLFREVEVTQAEADEGAERILDFDGAVEPMHIFFPKLFCTGQLFMVKKYKFLNEKGKKYKRNILIRVNIA